MNDVALPSPLRDAVPIFRVFRVKFIARNIIHNERKSRIGPVHLLNIGVHPDTKRIAYSLDAEPHLKGTVVFIRGIDAPPANATLYLVLSRRVVRHLRIGDILDVPDNPLEY